MTLALARRHLLGGLLATCAPLPLARRVSAQSRRQLGAEQRMGRLLDGIERVESLRAIKALQRRLALLIHYGRWDEAGALFAEDAALDWDGALVIGRRAIADHWRTLFAAGPLHAQMAMTPVVTLSPSGSAAGGRWHEVRMASGPIAWASSLMTADYALGTEGWRIVRLENHPIFRGTDTEGWQNLVADLPVIPYHYTPLSAATPETGGDVAPQPLDRLPGARRRIAALEAEDAARRLQNVYGYYVDRKMWDDVADLFGETGVLRIEGLGDFTGRARIRDALESQFGPAGLRHGEMNDHPQVNTLVTVEPSLDAVRVQGLDFGMEGINGGEAFWSLTAFDNRVVRQDGGWRFAEMALRPQFKADYYAGWNGGALLMPPGDGGVQQESVAPSGETRAPEVGMSATPVDLDEAETALARAAAADAIENVSSTLGNYLNDAQWYDFSRLFARDAWRRSPGAGYYRGRDRIWQLQETRNGPLRRPRGFLPLHLRIQPVITVADDARSAKLRTRLLQFNSGYNTEGSMLAGIYEDQLVLEDVAWRIVVDDIDHIWRSPSYALGWARLPEEVGEAASRSPDALLKAMPPDRLIEGRSIAVFPAITPVWFHYANPVSGRASPLLPPQLD